MKIYHSTVQVFAARIISIVHYPDMPGAGAVIHTDAEPVKVEADWLAAHKPTHGAYIVIGAKGATVMTEAELDAAYLPIGEKLLPGTITTDGAVVPPPVLPRQAQRFTFDQFVQFGRDNGGNIVSGMPWSFQFHGHAISHENDACYLISRNGQTRNFTPDDVLILSPAGAVSIERVLA